MNVIALKRLREFWEIHSDSEDAIKLWYHTAKKAKWTNFNEITMQLPGTRYLGNDRVSFKIKGNNYRLIVKVEFDRQELYIRFIGTHAEYDKLTDATKI